MVDAMKKVAGLDLELTVEESNHYFNIEYTKTSKENQKCHQLKKEGKNGLTWPSCPNRPRGTMKWLMP